jgi:hypothetical protein
MTQLASDESSTSKLFPSFEFVLNSYSFILEY